MVEMLKRFLLIVFTAFLFSACSRLSPQSQTAQTEPALSADSTESIPMPQETGFIRGTVWHPQDPIPNDLIACAAELNTQLEFCTQEQRSGVGFTDTYAFQLEVPIGEYYVYSYRTSQPNLKAYYSEFVTCGLRGDCPSHARLIVQVEEGVTINDIRPHDWFMPFPTPTPMREQIAPTPLPTFTPAVSE
jgi:hypothetical protein